MSTSKPQGHMLPPWFMWLFRHVALPGLVIAQMLNLFTALFQVRVVGSTWETWGITDWTGLAFAVGASIGMGLVTLGLSQAMADAFLTRRPWSGLIMLGGLLGMMSIEIVAALSATSSHGLTAFDQQIITTFALPIRLPILSIAAALALPLVVLFIGYANRPTVAESPEERAARFQREEAEASHRASMGVIRAKGLANLTRAGALALAGKADKPADDPTGNTSGLPSEGDPGMAVKAPPTTPKTGKRSALIFTGKDLAKWALDTHGVALTDAAAVTIIQSAKNARQLTEGYPGNPWGANRAAAIKAYEIYAAKRPRLRIVSGPSDHREEAAG